MLLRKKNKKFPFIGTLIRTKHLDEIIRCVYLIWIAYFGSPKKFLSDNGGEFFDETYREMNEKLNVVTLTTAGESSFSNGSVERHNLVVSESLKKTVQDVKCLLQVALVWMKRTLYKTMEGSAQISWYLDTT